MSNLAELAHDVTLSTEPGKLRLEQVARKHLARVRHKLLVQFGRPAELIEKGLSHLIFGSVAERTVRESIVPVLTVRGQHSVA